MILVLKKVRSEVVSISPTKATVVTVMKFQDHIVLYKKDLDENRIQYTIGTEKVKETKLHNYNISYKNSFNQKEKGVYNKIFTLTLTKNDKIINILEKSLNNNEIINVSELFEKDDVIKVSGKSKGCGFAGGTKRHGFKGLKKSHGVSAVHRSIGSTGCCKPSRVMKGRKMPGRMGFDSITIRGKIFNIENNEIKVFGSTPGSNKSHLVIHRFKCKNI